MSDRDDQVSAHSAGKVSSLPTPLARHIEFVNQVLEKSDAVLSENKVPERMEENDVDEGSRTELQQTELGLIELSSPQDGSDAILEALIGLGLMLVGLATMVAVAFLPRRDLTPIFVGAALILMGGGAWRFDKATRSHRMAKRQRKAVKRDV